MLGKDDQPNAVAIGQANMSLNGKFERSLLDYDEFETMRTTHHPAIYELSDEELRDTQARLREMRAKERTLARQKRREVRGKADPRGGSFPGTAEKPQLRKQVFSAALKRVNKELKRQKVLEARSANVEAARRALALRRAANFVHHPAGGETSDEGLRVITNRRQKLTIPAARIGSITKATKAAQAARDARD